MNNIDGLANQDGGVAPAETADDYDPGLGVTIIGATFSDVEDTNYTWNGEVRASVYANNGAGAPNETAFSTQTLSGADATRVANGSLFGRPRWDYTLAPNLSTPPGEVAWFSPVPRSGGPNGQAFFLTAVTPEFYGNSYFRSAFFGIPTWTPSSVDSDFAFTLTFGCQDCNTDGIPDDCDPDDCNTNIMPDVCDIAGGSSSDADADGVPDECPASTCATCPGDTNSDSLVDGDDIAGFVACLSTGFPCACTDMDSDGATADADVTDDLAAFVETLLSAPPPCP